MNKKITFSRFPAQGDRNVVIGIYNVEGKKESLLGYYAVVVRDKPGELTYTPDIEKARHYDSRTVHTVISRLRAKYPEQFINKTHNYRFRIQTLTENKKK